MTLGLAAGLLFVMAAGAAEKEEYLPGGPLAGLDLPLYRTQHGEPPGYPGCIPGTNYTPQGQWPELELYPGSVEHWRAYYFKYTPQRSLYDRQTLLKNFLAKDLVKPTQVETYAEPVYWVPRHDQPVNIGKFNAPVPVVRCKAGAPVLSLDFGKLKPGLYAVRVIAAVETAQLERHRKPIYLRMTVNDGVDGSTTSYRIRIGYVDEFYSVAEIHFHAPAERSYTATLGVDKGSLADLLVHNITLDDALAGFVRRPIKTRPTLAANPAPPARPATNMTERLARDAALWENFPPINAQWGMAYGLDSTGKLTSDASADSQPNLGAGGKSAADVDKEYGAWATGAGPVLVANAKLGLTYTIADLKAGRPLPDPYPFKDDGAGVYTPAMTGTPRGVAQNWFPVADAVRDRVWARAYDTAAFDPATVGEDRLRDEAVQLIRFAYDYPAMCYSHALSACVIQPGVYGRDLRCRRRDFRGGFQAGLGSVEPYDKLFPYIQGNEELAKSIGRFIPWVKSSKDLIELLDVYLVQMQAKQILRYRYYSHGQPDLIVAPATVLADRTVTDPWMDWMFSRAFMYPLPLGGFQDLLVTTFDRDGIGAIGSHMYARGELTVFKADKLDRYLAAGGNPKYNLSDRRLYPKVVESCYWPIRTSTAGLYFSRIGDVVGPEKDYAHHFSSFEAPSRIGWTYTRDPAFAYVLKHFFGRKGETDKDWAEIEAAAAVQKRAPWLENRSRMLPNWFGMLETGIEHDNPRFRRSVMLRLGQGVGHAHDDVLDLQIHAHGYPITIDGGQRPEYSKPDDIKRIVHNVATASGIGGTHAWLATLSDAPAARSMTAQIETGDAAKLHRRQVMLVDVDEGKGSRPLTPKELERYAKLDKGVVSPNSYVFDVLRLAGDGDATYQFHATVDDELAVNVDNRKPFEQLPEADQKFLAVFPDKAACFGGDAADTVTATWRNTREGWGSEKTMMLGIYDPESPRKFTRLHVFGQKGSRVLSGRSFCNASVKYSFGNVYVRRAPAETETVFPALVEPYVGEPFVSGARLLEVAGNDTDARRAVALEVKTVNGHTDLCFADGRPEKEREVRGQKSEVRMAAEFAYCSTDADGLRAAMISGGRLLKAPGVTIRPSTPAYTGRVTAVSYLDKTMTLDKAWPAALAASGAPVLIEVGVPGHRTAYMIRDVKPEGNGSVLTTQGGADFYLSRVQAVEPEKNRVHCAIGMPASANGNYRHWVASNEEMTKFWLASYAGKKGEAFVFDLSPMDGSAPTPGTPVVTDADFGKARGFRLWEYGVGDEVRCATWVSLRRIEPGKYRLEGNVDVEITVGGTPRKIAVDEVARSGGTIIIEAR